MDAYNYIIETEDWKKYSNCEEGYLNIRQQKLINGFISEFTSKCDSMFINNFKLIEKDLSEEMKLFNYSRLHYYNMERLLVQSIAVSDINLEKYSIDYLNILKDLERSKVESITRYFIENFELLKEKNNANSKTQNDQNQGGERDENFWEFENSSSEIKLAYWANNITQSRTITLKFDIFPIHLREFHKTFLTSTSVLRFFWTRYDIREYLLSSSTNERYSQYYTISGTYFIDQLVYPPKSMMKGSWKIRDMIGERYKSGDEGIDGSYTKNVKMTYKLLLSDKIFLKDKDKITISVADYNLKTKNWDMNFDDISLGTHEKDDKDGNKISCNAVTFTSKDLGIFSVLLERKINFPYKSWMLRCIKKGDNLVAILDLVTPRTTLVFELGVSDQPKEDANEKIKKKPIGAYVKLIDNQEEAFKHFENKELTFDEIILALKECGILICPLKEDLDSVDINQKNINTINRAVDDIVMCCRYYSIKNHEYNKLISTDLIAVKAKPNPEYDKKFLDDEPKDWCDFAWFPNKASIGKFEIKDNEISFSQTVQASRPHLHLIIKEEMNKEIYEKISEDDISATFLVNIRNFIRCLNLVNIP